MPLKPITKGPTSQSLYDADFHRWAEEQGRAIREQRLADIDWENVAEEIESLGRSDKRRIESNLNVILLHLLKWQFQPDRQKPGWRSSIAEHRARIGKLLRESPSLRSYPSQVLDEEYVIARMKAIDETGLADEQFPKTCPYTAAEVLDADFLPANRAG